MRCQVAPSGRHLLEAGYDICTVLDHLHHLRQQLLEPVCCFWPGAGAWMDLHCPKRSLMPARDRHLQMPVTF
jgi:hypothetical protein